MVDPISDDLILKRIVQQLRQGNIESRILEIVQQGFDNELDKNHILLARPEKLRLFQQSVKTILSEMLAKLN
jgi:hypothetical protein